MNSQLCLILYSPKNYHLINDADNQENSSLAAAELKFIF